MSALARTCFRRRRAVLSAWILALLGLAAAVLSTGTAFTDATNLPDSESSTAYALLAEAGIGSSSESGTIVWRSDTAVDEEPVRSDMAAMLDAVAALPGVEQVTSPYAEAGAAQLDVASSTAFATVAVADDVDLDAIRAAAEHAAPAGVTVALGGTAFTEQPSPSGGTEAIGILAALVILLVVFRSGWAAAMPIITGVTGVATSLLAVMLASHVVDLAATSLTMGALIGLGVGIDYALFIVNRHRKALMAGATVPEALAQAVTTSGRAVVFAGLTVVVALLGMFVVGLGILTGMAQAAAVTVLFTVVAAITLLPALLAIVGLRILSRKQRSVRLTGEVLARRRAPLSSRWALLLQRAPARMVALAVVVLVVLALPATTMRVGDADASSDPAGSHGRTYADLMAPAFGAGVDAPLVLVAQMPDEASDRAFDRLVADLSGVEGVASVTAPSRQGDQEVAVATVIPTTSAQTEQTEALVDRLRADVIPSATDGTGLRVLVGGQTATTVDMSQALMSKLPVYLALIATLGFLLLAMAFRSVLVPLVGAVSNLATIAVGLGAITAIFQHGWGSDLLGVGSGAPVTYLVPVLVVGVMFGLSMDYQVFLVSRMHEEWTHTRDNDRAVRIGVQETGPVIATAATIMLCVFASFGLSGERIVSSIGIGLAVAVLVDAFVVRLTLVPALMRLIGDRNWSYPRWADRITPHVSVEGPPAAPAPVPELATVGARATVREPGTTKE